MSDQKLNVLFIGSFKSRAKDGTVGGQGFACQSLVNSYLSEQIEWHLIDSTQKTQPPPNLLMRAGYAGLRILQVLRLLITGKVDTVLIFSSYLIASFLEKGLIAMLAALFRKRVVLAIRSEVTSFNSDRWASGYRKIVINSCDSIICQNAANVHALEKRFGVDERKYSVVPNWVDVSLYSPDSRPTENSSTPTDTQCHFIYLGWLIADKGVNELVEAARILQEQSVHFHLSICGGGDLYESIKQKINEYQLEQHVTLHGWVVAAEKHSLLNRSDVLVLPSYSEGMPNSVLEGMSSGLAVVATHVGGIPDLIRSDKQGLLVQPQDATALASAMKECTDAPERVKQMGRTNNQFVIDHHSLNVVLPIFSNNLAVVSN